MRSVRIRLEGSYWDSQLYGSELLLFTEKNSIVKTDWRALIDRVAEKHQHVRTAIRIAFVDGDLFYNAKVQKILRDPAVVQIIKSQLGTLADSDTVIRRVEQPETSEFDSPFNFVPVDTDMYYSTLLACSDEGMFSASRADLGRKGFLPKKHHDARFMQIRASRRHTAVASAAGSDGLIEFAFEVGDAKSKLGRSRVLSPRPCSACDWSFQSVMGWAPDSAFVAKFTERRHPTSRTRKVRALDQVYDVNELFLQHKQGAERSFTWGAREKFYRLTKNGLQIGELNSEKKVSNEELTFDDFRLRTQSSVTFDLDDVVSTGTAPFGTVIELSDKLIVMRSDGKVEEFIGEPVHWRIFPRSNHFSNQLHILYEDRLEIVSFVHDYFVDQSEKLFGFAREAAASQDPEMAAMW